MAEPEIRELALDLRKLRKVKHRFSVDDFYSMAQVGIFDEDSRVELIQGEVVEMNPVGSQHAGCIKRLLSLLMEKTRGSALRTLRASAGSRPPEAEKRFLRRATSEDVFLLVEVADTSLDYDLDVKVPLYAGFDIPEFWLVDLAGAEILAYSRPENGRYRLVERVKSGDTLVCRALPELSVKVESVLG